jgi:hypothetical protein
LLHHFFACVRTRARDRSRARARARAGVPANTPVYAYVPTTQSGFCSQSQITCNSDYGTSLARGSFSFATGKWQTIWLLVVLNEVGTANGVVQ